LLRYWSLLQQTEKLNSPKKTPTSHKAQIKKTKREHPKEKRKTNEMSLTKRLFFLVSNEMKWRPNEDFT